MREKLAPTLNPYKRGELRPNSVVIMDNARFRRRGGLTLVRVISGSHALVLPALHCGSCVTTRNSAPLHQATVNKTPAVRRLIARTGARLVYLPAYSPDKNPIEEGRVSTPRVTILRTTSSSVSI